MAADDCKAIEKWSDAYIGIEVWYNISNVCLCCFSKLFAVIVVITSFFARCSSFWCNKCYNWISALGQFSNTRYGYVLILPPSCHRCFGWFHIFCAVRVRLFAKLIFRICTKKKMLFVNDRFVFTLFVSLALLCPLSLPQAQAKRSIWCVLLYCHIRYLVCIHWSSEVIRKKVC